MAEMAVDFDCMVLSGLNATKAGFSTDEALAVYDRDDKDKYAIILTAKEGNETSEKALAVYEALQSNEVKGKIKELTSGSLSPMFE